MGLSVLYLFENSIIDIEPLRSDMVELAKFCKQIPKGGLLHVHPYGLFTRDVVTKILRKYNPVIDPEYFIMTVQNMFWKQPFLLNLLGINQVFKNGE